MGYYMHVQQGVALGSAAIQGAPPMILQQFPVLNQQLSPLIWF